MANGADVYRPVFLGSVEIGSLGIFAVELAALGGEYLLGRGPADRFLVALDHGRRIIVEP